MSKTHIEDSVTARIVVNLIDIALLCASLFLASLILGAGGEDAYFPTHLPCCMAIAALCYLPTIAAIPSVALGRTCSSDRILTNVLRTTTVLYTALLLVNLLWSDMHMMRREMITAYLLTTALLFAGRILTHKYVTHLRDKGRDAKHIILVGDGKEMEHLYYDLQDTAHGITIDRLFTTATEDTLPSDATRCGAPTQALTYLTEHTESTDMVFCSTSSLSTDDAQALYTFCADKGIQFRMVPAFACLTWRRIDICTAGDSVVLSTTCPPLSCRAHRLAKRLVDIVLSGAFLLTLFPIIYIIVAILIKCQSAGAVFHLQKRQSMDGKEFRCINFRTKHRKVVANKDAEGEGEARRFRFGEWLRRTGIDAIPQMINVFLGSMTLVGTQPCKASEADRYRQIAQQYRVHLWAKPGITSWDKQAERMGKPTRRSQAEHRAHAYIWYEEHWSLALDARIIASALIATLTGRGRRCAQ